MQKRYLYTVIAEFEGSTFIYQTISDSVAKAVLSCMKSPKIDFAPTRNTLENLKEINQDSTFTNLWHHSEMDLNDTHYIFTVILTVPESNS